MDQKPSLPLNLFICRLARYYEIYIPHQTGSCLAYWCEHTSPNWFGSLVRLWKVTSVSRDIKLFLCEIGTSWLSQVANMDNSDWITQAWKTLTNINIPERQWGVWNRYIRALKTSHIRISDTEDELIWAIMPKGNYTPKDGYFALTSALQPPY